MSLEDNDRKRLTVAVEVARRRVVANLAFHEASVAGAVALLGPTLLLLLGRRWVTWPVLLSFSLAGAGFAAWRLWRIRPGAYRVSQDIDARLASQDQISTAVYFIDSVSPAAIAQRCAAARLAEPDRVGAVFPYRAPRSLYSLAAVLIVCSTLWAVRYWLEKPLRIEQPLPKVIAQAWRGEPNPGQDRPEEVLPARHAAHTRSQQAEAAENLLAQVPVEGRQGQDAASQSPEATNEPGQEPRPGEKGPSQDAGETGEAFGDPMADNPDADPIQSYEDMLERDAKSGLQKAQEKRGKDGEAPTGADKGESASAEANSLLAKLRDAMNNMLSRLQQKAPGSGQKQQAGGGAQSSAGEQEQGAGEGQGGAGQPQPGGQEGGEGEGAEGESKDQSAQNSQGKAGGKSNEGGSRGTSGDGAGQQEGDKSIADAMHQEAMGKLSELYGQRATTVTGEVTIEAQAGKQSLRTPQSAKAVRHRDSGGEVSRDEIPLAYQAYVKEYFSKLRQAERK